MTLADDAANAPSLIDLEPTSEDFLRDVLAGLSATPRTIPSKYLYDRRGSELFDQICELPEYYPTRTELALLRRHAVEIAEAIGAGAMIIEYGSGSGIKTHVLLESLLRPAGYVPIEISRQHLLESASELDRRFTELSVHPVCGDYLEHIDFPDDADADAPRVAFFPGSTVGNFTPDERARFFRSVRDMAGPGGRLLIGVDRRKSLDLLLPAYNDAAGVTAAFNLNLLERINRELGGDFELDRFHHEGRWNDEFHRVEMTLVSDHEQAATVGDQAFHFGPGDTILTEYSHKFDIDQFVEQASPMRLVQTWSDPSDLFTILLLEIPE